MPFTSFRVHLKSIEKHLDHDRLNKTADLLKDRGNREDVSHADVMQADLVLYFRAEADHFHDRGVNRFHRWYPDSLLYARRRRRPFELFARAARGASEGVEKILDLSDWGDFKSLIQEIDEDSGFPKPGTFPLNVPHLVGIEQS